MTLDDLASWAHRGTALAVLGHPIGHSLSPVMHQAALADAARDDARFADWRYFRFDVPVEDLPRALDLLHRKRFLGLNLTVPHKVAAMGLVAEIDEGARRAGAVNTLLREETGWRGFNTDGSGFARAMGESPGIDLAGRHVLLLGAGGAARAVAAECLARGCASLSIANRSADKRNALIAELRSLAGRIPVLAHAGGVDDDPTPGLREGPEGDRVRPPRRTKGDRRTLPEPGGWVVVNATSVGLKPDDPAPIDLASLPPPAAVFDLIYNPPVTRLLRDAEALGIPRANGLGMLVHQGAAALEIWSGIPAGRSARIMLASLAKI